MHNFDFVYSLTHSEYLAKEFSEKSGIEKGDIKVSDFADGETQLIFTNAEEAQHKNIVLLSSLEADHHFTQMLSLIWATRHQFRASSVELIIPYLGYSTMEKLTKVQGEIARGIPMVQSLYAAKPNRIHFFDLHAEGYLNCGGTEVVGEHIISELLVIETIKKIQESVGEIVLISPDVGRGAWVKALAQKSANVYDVLQKDRFAHSKDLVEVSPSDPALVKNKTAIIFDDMIRTGGTAVKAAGSLKKAGAKDVQMIVSHLVLPDDSIDKIKDSPISKLYGTNSHSNSQEFLGENKVAVSSMVDLIIKHLEI